MRRCPVVFLLVRIGFFWQSWVRWLSPQRSYIGLDIMAPFLFPQMSLETSSDLDWSPHFVDYLCLAFNTSTALWPTDTPVLSRWAKTLMMIQAIISLAVLALLAARAVNIL